MGSNRNSTILPFPIHALRCRAVVIIPKEHQKYPGKSDQSNIYSYTSGNCFHPTCSLIIITTIGVNPILHQMLYFKEIIYKGSSTESVSNHVEDTIVGLLY